MLDKSEIMKNINESVLKKINGGSAFTSPSQDQYIWVNGKRVLVSPVIFGN